MRLKLTTRWPWYPAGLIILGVLAGGSVQAADYGRGDPSFGGPGTAYGVELPPRYFPRAEEEARAVRRTAVPRRRAVGCVPRRVPIPTDRSDDPSYVGSSYGLGKPSYYGFTPPLGFDDPYGRPLLPYCP